MSRRGSKKGDGGTRRISDLPDLPPYSRPPLDANLTRKTMSSLPVTKQLLELWDAFHFHKKHNNIRWGFLVHHIILHSLVITSFFYLKACKWQTLVFSVVLYGASVLGVTAGYHRLFSHNAHKANLPYRILMMLLCSLACQMSVYMWASSHTVHHKGEDTNSDPYSINRGFFFAHVGWLFLKPHKDYLALRAKMDLSFLKQDKVVMWQHRMWPHFDLIVAYVLPTLVAMYGWDESFACAFLVPGILRQASSLHATYAINSFSHWAGDGMFNPRVYEPNIEARDNFWMCLILMGEGRHNYHHKFPWDWNGAEHPWWKQYNPTSFFIDCFVLLGWVWGKKRALSTWHMIRDKRAKNERGEDEVEVGGEENEGAKASSSKDGNESSEVAPKPIAA